jgi:hypothetical protein
MEYFNTGQQPRRTKDKKSKEWFNNFREESKSRNSQTQTGTAIVQNTMMPMVERMKLEVKLETYDGAKDACEDWFFEMEKI